MRLLLIEPAARCVQDLGEWPTGDTSCALPALAHGGDFFWLSCERSALEAQLPALQTLLQQQCGTPLVDLHVSDLLNPQIPSTFDYTSDYDVLLFRGLDLPTGTASDTVVHAPLHPTLWQDWATAPVGFAVFDKLLLSVHPPRCPVRQQHLQRLLAPAPRGDLRAPALRLPASSADLMLRQVSQLVDGYLNLRRELAKQIEHWQLALLHPKSRFNDWQAVLQARLGLHQLDEICEDQRAAVQDWIDTLDDWPEAPSHPDSVRALELLRVRSRDVLEHIERVLHHVRRMEQSAETAVQMHFSAQSNRANDIMRTLTTLTAIFLPLNLIAAVFGMNFDVLPLVHKQDGFWWALAAMALIGLVLVVFFWRRRYLDRASLMAH